MNRRIFLSYGHDEHVEIARKLKADLTARGHDIWFDEERLLPGEDWESCIERGIDWAVSEPKRGCIILLMTPHAVRRPDGYCLNELARALSRGLRVVPIMLVWAEPPLSICRIQFLDLRDCIPIDARPAAYEGKFDRLVRAIEHDAIDFEGVQTRLLTLLDPLPFDVEVNQHLARFVGREWIFRRLDDWLADAQGEKIFWIIGLPGIGKTALSAKLASTRPEVVAVHFCQVGHVQKSDARRCVMSIAYQLSTQLPDYEERLNSLPLHTIIPESDAQTLFDRLILQPLSTGLPDPGRKLVVLIDALDEATRDGRNQLAALLASAFSKTPPWLRLIITSRPVPEVMYPLQAITAHRIDAASPDNRADLRTFLARELRTQLADVADPGPIVDHIVERSEGNFLYVEWLRQEVMTGKVTLTEAAGLPRGLGGIYSQFVARQWPDMAAFKSQIAPALEIIAAAREPLSLATLAEIHDWSERQQNDFETALTSLFSISGGRIVPFHKSLLDWLTDRDRAGPYFIGAADRNHTLADYCWRKFEQAPLALPDYALRHLPGHLLTEQRWDELEAVLTNLVYLEAKAERAGVFALAADFTDALAALPATRPLKRILQLLDQAIRREQHFIGRHPTTLFQCLWNLCWWCDSPAAAPHYTRAPDVVAESKERRELLQRLRNAIFAPRQGTRPPTPGRVQALYELMERWRGEKERRQPDFIWVRSLRPPALPLSAAHLVLGGNTGRVRGVSADGTRLVAASADGMVRMWDTRTGAELLVCRASDADEVTSYPALAISPDGQLLAWVASGSKAITLLDAATGRALKKLGSHETKLRRIAFSPDGRRLAAGAADGSIIIWDVDSGEHLARLRCDSGGEVESVAFSPDGTLLLAHHNRAEDAKTYIRLWDWKAGREIRKVRSFDWTVCPVRFSPDGIRFVAGGRDEPADGRPTNAVKVWTLESDDPLVLKDRSNVISDVSFSPDGSRLVSCGWNGSIRLWDLAKATDLVEVDVGAMANGVGYLADGRVYSSDNEVVRIWDDLLTMSVPPQRLGGDLATSLAYSPNGKILVHASFDGKIDFWDATTARRLGPSRALYGRVIDMAFSPDGRQLAVATRVVPDLYDASAPMNEQLSNYLVRIFNVAGRALLGTFSSGMLDDRVTSAIEYTADGNTVAILFEDDGPTIAVNARRIGKVEKLTGEHAAALRNQLHVRTKADAGSIEARAQGPEIVFIDRSSGREIAWFSWPLDDLKPHPSGRMWAGIMGNGFEMIAIEGMP